VLDITLRHAPDFRSETIEARLAPIDRRRPHGRRTTDGYARSLLASTVQAYTAALTHPSTLVSMSSRSPVSLAEAAERLGVSAETLRWQIHNGKLKARKVGPIWTVSDREIERYRRESLRVNRGPR